MAAILSRPQCVNTQSVDVPQSIANFFVLMCRMINSLYPREYGLLFVLMYPLINSLTFDQCLDISAPCALCIPQCGLHYHWYQKQRTISLMHYEFITEILTNIFCCNSNSNGPIIPQFCTCHDSWAVMACAKLWNDRTIIVYIKAIFVDRRFGLWPYKLFVEWIPEHVGPLCAANWSLYNRMVKLVQMEVRGRLSTLWWKQHSANQKIHDKLHLGYGWIQSSPFLKLLIIHTYNYSLRTRYGVLLVLSKSDLISIIDLINVLPCYIASCDHCNWYKEQHSIWRHSFTGQQDSGP